MSRVVVSVGTDHHRFDRMLDWIAAARDELGLEVFVQRGATPDRDGIETVDYLDADDLAARLADADAVVCHGGPGTISLAIRSGHRPIVVPRDPTLGEHVDDHQQRYTRKLAEEGSIDLAASLDELVSLLRAPRPPVDASTAADTEAAVARFGELVDRLLAGDLPKRRWRDRFLWRRT